MKRLVSWLVGLSVLLIRVTCRVSSHNDPRIWLRQQGIPYVYAALHAHHIGALLSAEPGTWAMVSLSDDGEMLVPALRISGVEPIRGSGGESRKGGFRALREMIVRLDPTHPAFLAVDGPKGPRGHVHEGVGLLAKKTGAVVLPVVVVPARRWIMTKAWDRLQFPHPFSSVEIFYGEHAIPEPGENLAAFADRVAKELHRLERQHDPSEADRVAKLKSVAAPAQMAA
jgi:lysophospholipid acyltransferase (LPLAT)-like uncharacterized protein